MKTLLHSVLLSAAVAFTAGCDASQQTIPFANKYQYLGTLHNEGLDAIRARFAAQSSIDPTFRQIVADRAATEAFVTQETASFVRAKGYTPFATALAIPLGRSAELCLSKTTSPDSVHLTEGQRAYAEQVLNLTEAASSATELDDQLANVEQAAIASLGAEEAAVVLQASAVARSSAQYWEENLPEWVEMVRQGNASLSKSAGPMESCWGRVARADALGALVGAGVSWWTGAGVVAGAGVGAIRGSAVSGIAIGHCGCEC